MAQTPGILFYISTAILLFFIQGLFGWETQIDAHLARYGKEISAQFNMNPYQDPIIQEMHTLARTYSKTHYELYHAQQGKYRIIQDIYKKLKEFFEITFFRRNFTFLRFDDPIFSQYTCIKDFLSEKIQKNKIINDMTPDIYTFLLSTNLSPFGNYHSPGESTYAYYLHNHSEHDVSFSLLNKICNSFDLPSSYVLKLDKLVSNMHHNKGTLFQILIPKAIIDNVGYKCFSYGTPFYTSWYYEDQTDNLIQPYQELSPLSCQQILNGLYSNQFVLSTLLELYRTQPELLHNMNSIQARLLLSNNYILNPNSGILINRFTHVEKNKLKHYEQSLDNVIDEILIDWIGQALSKSSLPQEQQNRIMQLLSKIMPQSNIHTKLGKITAQEVVRKVRSLQQANGTIKH